MFLCLVITATSDVTCMSWWWPFDLQGDHMMIMWPLHRPHMVITWWSCDHCTVLTWWSHDDHVTIATSSHGDHMMIMWPLHRPHMVIAWWSCDHCNILTWWSHDDHVTVTWSVLQAVLFTLVSSIWHGYDLLTGTKEPSPRSPTPWSACSCTCLWQRFTASRCRWLNSTFGYPRVSAWASESMASDFCEERPFSDASQTSFFEL